jgi:hypothetical protein
MILIFETTFESILDNLPLSIPQLMEILTLPILERLNLA